MPCESQRNGATGSMKIAVCDGTPDELLGMLNWRLTRSAKVPEYTANDTGGAEETSKGSKFYRGGFEVRAKIGIACPVDEGELYDCEFYLDEGMTSGFALTVRIEEIGEILVDVDASNNVTWPCTYKGHGPLTELGAQSSSGV